MNLRKPQHYKFYTESHGTLVSLLLPLPGASEESEEWLTKETPESILPLVS